jgi:hypothetical protein
VSSISAGDAPVVDERQLDEAPGAPGSGADRIVPSEPPRRSRRSASETALQLVVQLPAGRFERVGKIILERDVCQRELDGSVSASMPPGVSPARSAQGSPLRRCGWFSRGAGRTDQRPP